MQHRKRVLRDGKQLHMNLVTSGEGFNLVFNPPLLVSAQNKCMHLFYNEGS